jgi:hypothetical protein
MEEEILFIALKKSPSTALRVTKQKKDCNVQQETAPKKAAVSKNCNVIVKSEKISRGYLFPIIGTECSTFFTDKGLLRFHRVFPSAFRDNNQ